MASLRNPHGQLFDVGTRVGQGIVDFHLAVSPHPAVDLALRNRAIGTVTEDEEEAENILEDAYLIYWFSPQFLLEGGKDRVREGVGYAWNPVDLLRTRSSAGLSQDPKEQRDHRRGHYLIKGELRWGQGSVAVAYVPKFAGLDTDDVSNLAEQFWGRGTALIAGTDVAVYLHHGPEWNAGTSLARVFGDALELHLEAVARWNSSRERPVIARVRGRSGNTRVPLWRRQRTKNLLGEALLGAQYTFSNGINLIAEYFYNGDGLSAREWNILWDGLELARQRLQGGENSLPGKPNLFRIFGLRANELLSPAESARHYLFVRAAGATEMRRRLELTGFLLLNLQDRSGALNGEARYQIGRDLESVLSLDLFFGPERTEFGALPIGSAVRASLRYAF